MFSLTSGYAPCSLRWLDTELHTYFLTSGSLDKPSRYFNMLA